MKLTLLRERLCAVDGVENELADVHSRVEQDVNGSEVDDFKRDRPLEPGVDRRRRKVDEHPAAGITALPFDARAQGPPALENRKLDGLERFSQNELVRRKRERLSL